MSVFAEFCAAGLWTGVGSTLAGQLAAAGITGPGQVSVANLAALPRVTDRRANRLYTAWIGAGHAYELAELTVPQGIPVRWVPRLIDALGDGAAAVMRADPWRLLVLPDASVPQADRLGRSLQPGVRSDDPRRARALVDWVLAGFARDGHTAAPADLVGDALRGFGIDTPSGLAAAIDAAMSADLVVAVPDPTPAGERWVARSSLAAAEDAVARHLRRLQLAASPLAGERAAKAAAVGLDHVQAAAVIAAARHGVSILTGGPGTGKSRTVAAVVGLCRSLGRTIALAAPTGRAAKRLTELVAAGAGGADGQSGWPPAHGDDGDSGEPPAHGDDGDSGRTARPRPTPPRDAPAGRDRGEEQEGGAGGDRSATPASEEAVTIHRLLGARRGPGERGSIFEHDEDDPIDADMVVVDEASMLDVELAAALLAAIPSTAHLLFVGDPAQLPSIGPGRVLGDLLQAGPFPVTELTRLYRQSEGGAIARLATAVRGGDLLPADPADREVVIVPAAGSAEASRRVVQLVTDSIPRVFGTRADQIQVVTPVHRGPAGTAALNRALKAVLNPGRGSGPGQGRSVRGFDVGDRVVATANYPAAEPSGYANGEVGTVIEIGDKAVLVAFPGGESEISGKALGDLMHGWAVTVHRAQGSEWAAVVVVLPPEATRMLSRPLVYTALTRARTHLSVVHAAGPVLARAVRQVGSRPRRTRLAALLLPDSSNFPPADGAESPADGAD